MPLAALPVALVSGLIVFGFVMAVVGHAAGDRRVVAVGLAFLFAGTALLFLSAYQDYDAGGRVP